MQSAGPSAPSIIRRTVHHPAPRTPLSGMDDSPNASGSTARPDDQWQGGPGPSSVTARGSETEEEAMIKELVRPPPIPGVEDYGMPPPSTKLCDPALEVGWGIPYVAQVSESSCFISDETSTVPSA